MQLPNHLPVHNEPALPRERHVPAAMPYLRTPERQDFMDVLRRLWRHRFLVLASTIALGAAAVGVAMRLPSHYIAEARVLIGVPEPKLFSGDDFIRNVSPNEERVEDEGFVIQSRALAKKVIDRLHLADNPEFNPALAGKSSWLPHVDLRQLIPTPWYDWLSAQGSHKITETKVAEDQRNENRMIDRLLSRVDVTTMGRSNVLSVQADSKNPDTAAAIANALAAAYLQEQRGQKVATTNRIEKYLQDRIAELRGQVEKSEQAVEDYRRQYGLYKGESAGLTSQQLTELNTQMILAQTNKAEADSRLREAIALESQGVNSDSVPQVLSSPTIQALKEQQAAASQRLAQLSANYGERYPKVLNAKAELNDIKRKLRIEVSRVISSLRHEARTADARYAALNHDFSHTKGEMGGVNDKAIHLEALERDATVNRNLLEAMLSRAKEAIGQQTLEQPDARLISNAAPPEAPSYPPKGIIAFLGTLGGLLIGIMAALLREGADRTFRRGDQIEAATGLPVMAMVPALRGGSPPTAHVLRNPVSPFGEALRKIYIGLELSESAKSPRTVMFGSATPGEGKSVIVASLGRLLASNGKRIMLIDCDWRCPNLHRLFRCPNKGGLAALMTDENASLNDIVHNDALSGLDLIVAGNWSPKSIHMLTSERMRLVLKTFAKNYDLVILDCPPVLVGAEVLSLSRMVDKTVFAVRWGHTRREAALEALKQLVEARSDVAGVVMSRVDARRYRQYSYGHLNYEYARPSITRVG